MPSATNTNSPSPSPPPLAPTALTPGPRALAFTDLYAKTLHATLGAISYDTFAECFPQIAASAPQALQALHSGMVGKLGGFAKDEFENILVERRVVENLNRLEDVIAEARRRKARAPEGEDAPVAPHTLPPEMLVQGHVGGVLNSQQSQLNAKLQTAQSQNAMLRNRMEEQRKEIETLIGSLDIVVKDLEGAGTLVGNEGEGLAAGSREAEGAIEDVKMGGS